MLAAELHGKISDRNISDRMEDVLTSYVMSLFRYLNNLYIPLLFLSQARNLHGEFLHIGKTLSAVELFFWPKFSLNDKSSREPDALLVFSENLSNCDIAIEIEAKYLSGLSNIYTPEFDEDMDEDKGELEFLKYGHQLADEYCGLYCGNWNLETDTQKRLSLSERKYLVFITGHYELPRQDLLDAVYEVEQRKCYNTEINCGLNPGENIFWVSWRQLSEILETESLAGYPDYSQGEINLLEDIRNMLIGRGLVPFTVWQNLQPVMVYKSFWERKAGIDGGYWAGLEVVSGYIPFLKKF
ncbi:MAG TPA: hypothetical protein GXX58_01890 [Gelria sp.]|jgi:hypothetical protein|nr:hypothetical protein [Gelria sp.]